jgi:hypothetical protein
VQFFVLPYLKKKIDKLLDQLNITVAGYPALPDIRPYRISGLTGYPA